MSNAEQVIAESRAMLEEFLSAIGLCHSGEPLRLTELLDPFAVWICAQEVDEKDRFYLASRVGAFVCEYLVETRSAIVVVEGNRILLRVPVGSGILREFDPYAAALAIVVRPERLGEILTPISN